jgi:hypothetical protein
MAIPLRSNIFQPGSYEREHFLSFPIQVAILFSPRDEAFGAALRDAFLHLDQLTGDDVVFFAVLDPPDDWRRAAETRPWWNAYEHRLSTFGKVGFSMDDAVLVRELARLFHLSWSALPAIAAGSDLWSGEFVTSPTSSTHLAPQLEALTKLVRKCGQPTIEQVDETLTHAAEAEGHIHDSSPYWASRLHASYQVLETVVWPGRPGLDIVDLLPRELSAALAPLANTRRVVSGDRPSNRFSPNPLLLAAIEDAAGRLVPAATVAQRLHQRLNETHHAQIMTALDEESAVMIEQSLRVGDLLERAEEVAYREGRPPFNRPPRGRGAPWPDGPRRERLKDYAPGAVGVWKAFEREINLSVIQVARQGRSIPMPHYFARFAPPAIVPNSRCQVVTGYDQRHRRSIIRNINQKDRKSRVGGHVFLSIGDALGVTRALSGPFHN